MRDSGHLPSTHDVSERVGAMAKFLARGVLRHLAHQGRCGVSAILPNSAPDSLEFIPRIPLTGPHGLTQRAPAETEN